MLSTVFKKRFGLALCVALFTACLLPATAFGLNPGDFFIDSHDLTYEVLTSDTAKLVDIVPGGTTLTAVDIDLSLSTDPVTPNSYVWTATDFYGDGTAYSVQAIDFSDPISSPNARQYLKEIDISGTLITSVDVSGCEALWRIYMQGAMGESILASANIQGCPQLSFVYFRDNVLGTLNASNLSKLDQLYVEFNELTSLDVSNSSNLTILGCQHNKLTSLDVTSLPLLTRLDCGNNELASLDLSKNTKLDFITCPMNKLTELDLSNLTILRLLECSGNPLGTLDVSKNPDLIELFCNNCQLVSLDVSKCPDLEHLVCIDNYLLQVVSPSGLSLIMGGEGQQVTILVEKVEGGYRSVESYPMLAGNTLSLSNTSATYDSNGYFHLPSLPSTATFSTFLSGITANELDGTITFVERKTPDVVIPKTGDNSTTLLLLITLILPLGAAACLKLRGKLITR